MFPTNFIIIKSFTAKLLFIAVCCFYSNISFSADINPNLNKSLLQHQTNTQITAAVPRYFPPFYYTDSEGLPYGMGIEVITEIDHSAGYLTRFVIKESWGDVFKAIDSGEAQIVPNLGITEERKKLYFFSKPYARTDITVFTRTDNKIKSEAALTNLHIGVVKKNAGKKIAFKRKYKNIHVYDSIKSAFDDLINKKIDAIIYPKLITKTAADQLNIKHLIYDTNITLKTIHRALAVSKNHPEIFEKLNASLNSYMKTQEFTDTYTAWYGSADKTLTNTQLIFINLAVLIFTIFIINYLWKHETFAVYNNNDNDNKVWVVTLVSILIVATISISLITTLLLYETSFNEQRHRLIDIVKSRARLIESMARYAIEDTKQHPHTVSNAHTRTINQVIDAHKHFSGFGNTGEFTFARKNKNVIEYVMRQRHSALDVPQPISFDSMLAVPMRLALLGHSGTIVAKDYRGQEVLAAYEPVSVLNMGIVAKIDIDEIRAPYLRSALYILTIVILISFFGSLLFFYIMLPITKKVHDSEQRFQQLFLNNYTPALLVNANNEKIIDANTSALNFYGYTWYELYSYKLDILCANKNSENYSKLHEVKDHDHLSITTQHRLKNGEVKDVEILMSPVEIGNETVIYCTILDITEKLKTEKEHQRLEKDLVQARKMEALGQLTGGIAHDFNNMLGIIMGYTELSREKIEHDPNNKIPGYLDHIMTASNHAKELISSMMLFSRTDEGSNIAINIPPLVKEDIKLLRSIIPTSINIASNIDETVPTILIEPVKLQQLIMNLCVNARDAMDAQGTLVIELTYRKNVNNNCLICYKHVEGDWVELTVSDTGSGMSEDILQHLFEPFFTTKGQHKGTGMGMAVVHGIVQDLGGHIVVDTEIGKGTSIHILFKPISSDEKIISETNEVTIDKEQHNQKILVVDDEESLAEMVADILELYGYQCTCFSSSRDALYEFTLSPNKFDLIFSDQTMPVMTGLEMIKAMRKIRPEIPAVIATGFSDSIDETIAEENKIALLRKPLPKDKLVETVNNIFSND